MYEPEKPVDHDAERALLSSTIISNEVVGDLIAAGVTEETFFDGTHKDMWKIVALVWRWN
jgi:replicative DNA helicase